MKRCNLIRLPRITCECCRSPVDADVGVVRGVVDTIIEFLGVKRLCRGVFGGPIEVVRGVAEDDEDDVCL